MQTLECGSTSCFSIMRSGGLFSNTLYVSIISPASSGLHANIRVKSHRRHTRVKYLSAWWGSLLSTWNWKIFIEIWSHFTRTLRLNTSIHIFHHINHMVYLPNSSLKRNSCKLMLIRKLDPWNHRVDHFTWQFFQICLSLFVSVSTLSSSPLSLTYSMHQCLNFKHIFSPWLKELEVHTAFPRLWFCLQYSLVLKHDIW